MHRLASAAAGLALLLAACGDTTNEPNTANTKGSAVPSGELAASEGPLNDQLAAKRAAGRKKMPAEVKELFARSGKELAETKLLATALRTGASAPDFTLKDALSQDVSLAAMRKEGPVVVTFYRGKW